MTGSSSPTTSRRRVRHVDVWSVFKISLLFFFVCGIVWLVAVLIVWNVINAFGWVTQLEELTSKLVGGAFRLDSGTLLQAAVLIDIVTVVGFTVAATLLAVLYNLISDVVGGVNMTVEETVDRRDRRLLSGLSLPFRKGRKEPAVDGIGTSPQPAAAAAASRSGHSPRPATQPARPPAGGGAVTVKRAPQPTRGAGDAKGDPSRSGGDGAARTAPKPAAAARKDAAQPVAKAAAKDGQSVAPVPPKAAAQQRTKAVPKPAAGAKADGKG